MSSSASSSRAHSKASSRSPTSSPSRSSSLDVAGATTTKNTPTSSRAPSRTSSNTSTKEDEKKRSRRRRKVGDEAKSDDALSHGRSAATSATKQHQQHEQQRHRHRTPTTASGSGVGSSNTGRRTGTTAAAEGAGSGMSDLQSKRKLAEIRARRRQIEAARRSHHSASVAGGEGFARRRTRVRSRGGSKPGEEDEDEEEALYFPRTDVEWLLVVFEEDTVYREQQQQQQQQHEDEEGKTRSRGVPMQFSCTCCEVQLGPTFEKDAGPCFETLRQVYHHCSSASHRSRLRELFPESPRLYANAEKYLDPDGFHLMFVNGYPTLSYAGAGGFFQSDTTTELTSIELIDASDPFGQSGLAQCMQWHPDLMFASQRNCNPSSFSSSQLLEEQQQQQQQQQHRFPAFVGATRQHEARSLLYGCLTSESFKTPMPTTAAKATLPKDGGTKSGGTAEQKREILVVEEVMRNVLLQPPRKARMPPNLKTVKRERQPFDSEDGTRDNINDNEADVTIKQEKKPNTVRKKKIHEPEDAAAAPDANGFTIVCRGRGRGIKLRTLQPGDSDETTRNEEKNTDDEEQDEDQMKENKPRGIGDVKFLPIKHEIASEDEEEETQLPRYTCVVNGEVLYRRRPRYAASSTAAAAAAAAVSPGAVRAQEQQQQQQDSSAQQLPTRTQFLETDTANRIVNVSEGHRLRILTGSAAVVGNNKSSTREELVHLTHQQQQQEGFECLVDADLLDEGLLVASCSGTRNEHHQARQEIAGFAASPSTKRELPFEGRATPSQLNREALRRMQQQEQDHHHPIKRMSDGSNGESEEADKEMRKTKKKAEGRRPCEDASDNRSRHSSRYNLLLDQEEYYGEVALAHEQTSRDNININATRTARRSTGRRGSVAPTATPTRTSRGTSVYTPVQERGAATGTAQQEREGDQIWTVLHQTTRRREEHHQQQQPPED